MLIFLLYIGRQTRSKVYAVWNGIPFFSQQKKRNFYIILFLHILVKQQYLFEIWFQIISSKLLSKLERAYLIILEGYNSSQSVLQLLECNLIYPKLHLSSCFIISPQLLSVFCIGDIDPIYSSTNYLKFSRVVPGMRLHLHFSELPEITRTIQNSFYSCITRELKITC